MKLPSEINVTEQTVDISSLSDKQTTYYHQLANDLEEKYNEHGKGRQIFTLSGPPGSGKSVVSAILNYIYSHDASFTFINVGLDAFHFSNTKLTKNKLLDVKGQFDTYDTEKLFTKMLAFKAGKIVSFPYYSRETHNPIEDDLQVTGKNVLLLLEGQWLLRNAQDWANTRELSSYNLAVKGSIGDMRENVIRRHMAGGRTAKNALDFYKGNDTNNTQEIAKNSVVPDRKVLFYKDI